LIGKGGGGEGLITEKGHFLGSDETGANENVLSRKGFEGGGEGRSKHGRRWGSGLSRLPKKD